MANYNRVIMIGNLTRDPEYKQVPTGQNLCRLGLAVNRNYKSRQGSTVQEVCFIDIDVWGAQADSCQQYLKKGRPVLIEGRLKFDSWQDTQGQTRSKHIIVADRVVFLQSGASADASPDEQQPPQDEIGIMPAKSTISAPLEKEIMDQIEAIKSRPKTARALKKEPEESPAPVEFKDEPPFQDELPF